MAGLLGYFLFQRTATQGMYALGSNKDYFTYRQVKPFDAALARSSLEALFIAIIAAILLAIAALVGHRIAPEDPLLVLVALTGLWLLAFGYGIITSVCIKLVPEARHVLGLFMTPLYLISGVMIHIGSVPMPYRGWLMLNPLAQGLELVRVGYFPYYHAASGLSLSYLYGWAISLIFVGLVLYRRFHLRLVMR
jgi:capsular polysaccharide transport system permease protein